MINHLCEAHSPAFSVIVPCYNEEESIPELLARLTPELEQHVGNDWEVIFIDDGSHDRTLELIAQANHADQRIKGVSFSRNFGHQAAVSCGLELARGAAIGIMDCDLQDTPEVLVQLYRRVAIDGYDVCYGVRKQRDASLLKRICYKGFYRVMRKLSEHPWPEDAGDFSVISRRVQQTILNLPEHVRVLRGLRSWVGFKQTEIAVERPDRKHGTAKYNFFKLWSLALTSLAGFSYVPLRLASMLGITMGFFSLVLGTLFLINRWNPRFSILSYYIGANPGTTTIILYLSIVSAMLFFCFGIMGEYLVVLVKEVKRRPSSIVNGTIGDVMPRVLTPGMPGRSTIFAAPSPACSSSPSLTAVPVPFVPQSHRKAHVSL